MDAFQTLDSRLLAEQMCRNLRENDRPAHSQAIRVALTSRQYLQFHFARQVGLTIPGTEVTPPKDPNKKDPPNDDALNLI